MAKGDVVISATIDEKEIENSLKKIEVSVTVSCDKIAESFDKMISRIEGSFKGISSAGKEVEKLTDTIKAPKNELEELNNYFRELEKADLSKVGESLNIEPAISNILFRLKELNSEIDKIQEIRVETGGEAGSAQELRQRTIEVNQLHAAMAALQATQQKLNQPDQFVSYARSLTEPNAQLKRMSEYYKDLEKTTLATAKEQEKASNIIQKALEKENKEREKALKLAEKKAIPTYAGAMDMPNASINERIEKIKALEKVQKSLSTTDANYTTKLKAVNAELQRLKRANTEALTTGVELEKRTNKLSQAFQNLGRRLIVYASIGAATGFVKSLAQVRGQYELLERSLGAIIQDYDKATQIFQQQQAEALKSPFTLIDLATATKQLAAYRIATDELVPTTKMLADISAGLGVEMERLVYNFGQTRAQMVLTARDLRDYANMGLPLLQELAKYYSQLQGRIVSTGEVFSMVSNRMVTFGDVEKILKKLTAEGGTFFNMQAIQAETLKGQLGNLQDAYEQMLNAIGKENQGTLTNAVGLVRALIDNWRIVLDILQALVLAYGGVKAAQFAINATVGKGNVNLEKQILLNKRKIAVDLERQGLTRTLTAAETQLITTRNKATAADYRNILSSKGLTKQQAIYLVALNKNNTALIAAVAQSKLLNATEIAAARSTSAIALGFKSLAIGAKAAGAALKSMAASFLPFLAIGLIVEGVMKLWSYFSDNSKALDDINKKFTELEKKLSSISVGFSKAASKLDFAKQKESLQSLVDIATEEFKLDIEIDWSAITEENIAAEFARIRAIIERQKIFSQKFEIAFEQTEQNIGKFDFGADDIKEDFQDLTKASDAYWLALNTQIDKSIIFWDRYGDTLTGVRKEALETIKAGRKTDARGSYIESQLEYTERAIKALEILGYSYGVVKEKAQLEEDVKEALKEWDSFLSKIEGDVKRMSSEEAAIALKTFIDKKALDEGWNEMVKDYAIRAANTKFNLKIAFVEDKPLKTTLTDWQKSINNFIDENTSMLDKASPLQIFKIQEGSEEDSISLLKRVNEEKVKLEEQTEAKRTQIAKTQSAERKKALEDELAILEFMLSKTVILWRELGGQDKKTGDKKNVALEQLKKQISLIEKMQKAYADFYKVSGNKQESLNEVTEAYGDAFKNVGLEIENIGNYITATKTQTADLIRNLPTATVNQEFVTQTTAEMVFEASIELKQEELTNFQKQLEDALSGYQLSMEIKSMGDMGAIFQNMLKGAGIEFEILSVEDTINQLEDLKKDILKNTELTENERAKLIKKVGKEIEDIRKKEATDILKNYEGLLAEYSKFEYERVKAAQKASDDIKAIEELQTKGLIDEVRKRELVAAVDVKQQQTEAQISFTQFKGSDAWVSAFENLNRVSSQSIAVMITKLEEFKKSEGKTMDPANLREYMNTLNKLKETLEDRTPFRSFINGIKEANAAQKDLETMMAEQGYGGTAEQFVAEALATQIQLEQEINNLKTQRLGIEFDIAKISNQEGKEEVVIKLREQIAALEKQLAQKQAKQAETSGIIEAGDRIIAGWDKVIKSAKKVSDQISIVIANFKEFAEAIGMESDSIESKIIDLVGTIMNMGVAVLAVATMTAESIKTVERASVILAIIGAALAVATAIANLFGNKNKKIDKAIEESERKVTALKNTYKALERTVEKAMGSSEMAAKKALISNLELQKAEIRRQIQLEESRSKKKRDEEKIADLKQQLKELNWEIQDIADGIVNDLLGTTVKDAAQSFVDEWIEAWKEGADTMELIESKFEEMIDGMIAKAVAGAIIQTRMQKIYDAVAKATEDNIVTPQEYQAIKDLAASEGQIINDLLKNFAGDYGLAFGSALNEEAFSGLQKGIASITEQTAGEIESKMNILTFNSYVNIDLQRQILVSQQANLGINSNLLLTARESYQLMEAMYSWTQSITAVTGGTGGAGIKTWLQN